MKTYVRIVEGVVFEVIPPFAYDDGVEVPMKDRYVPEFVDQCVEVTGMDPLPDQNWTYKRGKFAAPAPIKDVDPIAAVVIERDRLLSYATLRMAPLVDAQDLGSITDAEASMLMGWKQYRVDLNRIGDQIGYPDKIDWPVAPE